MDAYTTLVITHIIRETADTKSFVLERLDGQPIPYQAGQFLTLVFQWGGQEVRRSYSISTSPLVDTEVAITVKRQPNGEASRWLCDHAQVGDHLQTIGASGYFTLPNNLQPYRQVVLLAAGSGITPCMSLIKTLLADSSTVPLLLIYSNRNEERTIYYQTLKTLAQQHPERLQIEWIFSATADGSHAHLGNMLLERLMQQYLGGNLHNVLFYLCGPFGYMQTVGISLIAQGAAKDHIRKENFSAIKPTIVVRPPDEEPHQVTVELASGTQHFTVQYPDTILSAAKKRHIPLPYSCETGQCGTCAAICTAGKVWMANNEVLMDKEIAQGRILTCTGYPINGDVVLRYR